MVTVIITPCVRVKSSTRQLDPCGHPNMNECANLLLLKLLPDKQGAHCNLSAPSTQTRATAYMKELAEKNGTQKNQVDLLNVFINRRDITRR